MVCPVKENVRMAPAPNNEVFADPTGLFARGPGLAFMPEYQLNLQTGVPDSSTLYKRSMMSVPISTHPFCATRDRFRNLPMSDSCVLKLKGLPYSTTEQEIYDFFVGYEVRKVAFVLESDGRPSGLVSMPRRGVRNCTVMY